MVPVADVELSVLAHIPPSKLFPPAAPGSQGEVALLSGTDVRDGRCRLRSTGTFPRSSQVAAPQRMARLLDPKVVIPIHHSWSQLTQPVDASSGWF